MSPVIAPELTDLRVAIVHDWLYTYAGAERVLEQMVKLLPQCDLYASIDFLPEGGRGFILNKPVHTSFIQHLPLARSKHRSYLPLMPLAIEQFDLSAYDLVFSSSHAIAKGVITGPDQLHLCMCYSPIRYGWDLQHQYLKEARLERGPLTWPTRWMLHRIRQWDTRTANGVDAFIAISRFIARRIHKVYRREATVIYPPVDLDGFALRTDKEDFYLTASRMVPYKKIDLIVEAFARLPDKRLVVIGEGPDFDKVKSKAGPNVTLLGYQPFEVLKDHMQRARAFVFAAEEDFGIVPIEAQACGTPVIAYGKGATLETIRGLDKDPPTGVFFAEQTAQAIAAAVAAFETNAARFDPQAIRAQAQHFATPRFQQELTDFVMSQWQAFEQRRRV